MVYNTNSRNTPITSSKWPLEKSLNCVSPRLLRDEKIKKGKLQRKKEGEKECKKVSKKDGKKDRQIERKEEKKKERKKQRKLRKENYK